MKIAAWSIVFAAVCLVFSFSPLHAAEPQDVGPQDAGPQDAEAWLNWFSERWDETDWGPQQGSRKYMRPLDDFGWQARMRALREIVAKGEDSIPALVKALQSKDDPTRILAAQALGYLAPHAPRDALEIAAANDASAAVRLYSVDSLGMQGNVDLSELLEARLKSETNRDVKSHLRYALSRKKAGIDPKIVETLARWDPKSINMAEVGKPAPEFDLKTVDGESVRLSDFRGKKAIVLVFIYGDT